MAQWVKSLPCKHGNVSSIPGSHRQVEKKPDSSCPLRMRRPLRMRYAQSMSSPPSKSSWGAATLRGGTQGLLPSIRWKASCNSTGVQNLVPLCDFLRPPHPRPSALHLSSPFWGHEALPGCPSTACPTWSGLILVQTLPLLRSQLL